MGTPASSTIGQGSRVKLPKLVPKKFNGDLAKWSTFWDLFESSIHFHPDLSEIEKLNYLHTLLDGPASDAISGLKLTAPNYTKAIIILKKRYGNRQQIITKHMDLLMNIDPHNLKELRQLHDTVESQVHCLKSLGVSADTYDSLLLSVLMNKFPQEFRLIVSRHVREDEWTLGAIMDVTEREVIATQREPWETPVRDSKGQQRTQ